MIKLTLRRSTETAASARFFTVAGNRARQNLMELNMAMVVKAWCRQRCIKKKRKRNFS